MENMKSETKNPEPDYCFSCGKPLDHSGIYCSSQCELHDQDDDYDSEPEEDEFELAMDECGMMLDGTCSMFGSEYCEFDCPLQKDLF